MSYRSYIPVDVLKPFVKAFVISEDEHSDTYKVLPGTSIVMGFQYSGKLSLLSVKGSNPLSSAGITGLADTYKIFNNTENTGTILVMFSETGAAAFFKQQMHEIFGQSISLDDLILKSQMDVVVQQLHDGKTDLNRIKIVEEFLISRLNLNAKDDLVVAAIQLIRKHSGLIKVKQLTEHLYISQSQLEKRFRKIVGTTPKKFASIIRLQNLLNRPKIEGSFTQLALDAGYYDQAHFIKDFKSFTGETPEQFFKG